MNPRARATHYDAPIKGVEFIATSDISIWLDHLCGPTLSACGIDIML
jgi:hypothetical protein